MGNKLRKFKEAITQPGQDADSGAASSNEGCYKPLNNDVTSQHSQGAQDSTTSLGDTAQPPTEVTSQTSVSGAGDTAVATSTPVDTVAADATATSSSSQGAVDNAQPTEGLTPEPSA
ncbi:F-box-like/WD repeat-containing protein ebi, partial [Aplysia californica]|uniref:F-box-like/WD repeat-containing protein ebi n=1 Tax=Aplysia californica TaxID=6500 RepID=A0ABM1W3B4_APLCA